MADKTVSLDVLARARAEGFESVGKSFDGIKAHTVAVGAAVGVMGAQIVSAGLHAGASAIKAGIQTAAGMEQAQIAFETLLGSGQKAQSFLDDLSTFAAQTPFELPGLIDASRQLIGVGMNAKNVIPTLTAFGDASGALGLSQDNFNHIMMATTQAMSAGSLHAGDLLQMTEAGLPVWKLLSEALHKPVSELKKMSEGGQLLTADVMPKLQAQMEKDYGGAMAKQSKTLTGLWSTMTDTFHQGMAKALIPMEPMLRSAIPGAARVMGVGLAAVGKGASNFFNGLSGNVKRMDQSDRPKLELFGMGLSAMWQAFREGDVTSTGFIGTMERVGVGARDAFGWISNASSKAFDAIKANGPQVFDGLEQSVTDLASVALPMITDAWRAFREPLTDVIQFAAHTAIPTLTSMTGFLADHKTMVESAAVALGSLYVAVKTIRTAQSAWATGTKAMTSGQKALNQVMAMNPWVRIALLILAVGTALVTAYQKSETFRNVVKTVFEDVELAFLNVGKFAISYVLIPVLDVFSGIVHGAAAAFGWVPRIGGKLKKARSAFDSFRRGVDSTLHGIDVQITDIHARQQLRSLMTWMRAHAQPIIIEADLVNKDIRRGQTYSQHAAGGAMTEGWNLLGEQGQEWAYKHGSDVDVYPHGSGGPAAAASMPGSGGGRGGTMVLEVRSGGAPLDELLVTLFRKYVRVNGGDVQTVLGQG